MLGSVAIALALRVGGTALWLLFTILVARTLSVEEFGFVFFAINVIMTGGSMAVIGYNVTVLRFGSRLWSEDDKQGFRNLLGEARRGILGAGLIAAVALMFAALAGLDTPVTNALPIAALVGVSIIAVGFMSVERDALRAAGKLQEALFAFSVIRALVPLVLCGVAWLFGVLTAQTVLILFFAGLSVAVAWDWWRIGKLSLPKRNATKAPHLKVALTTWPGETALVIFQRAPAIVIGLTGGLSAAALFIAAERVSQLGVFLTDAVRTAVSPNIAQADGEERQRAVTQASLLMLISGSAGLVALLVLGWVFLWVFGPEYKQAFPALLMLLLGQISWTVLGPTGLVLNMMGENKVRSLIGAASTAALLLLLPFVDSALGTATLVAIISWAMNMSLWLAIRIRLDIKCGLPGIRVATAKQFWREERRIILKKIQSKGGKT